MSLIKANAHQVGDYTLTNEGGKLVINQGTPDTILNPVGVFGLNGLEYDGAGINDVLDGAKSLHDYAALRAYTGRAKRIYITGLLVAAKPAGIAGVFQYDPTDTTSADNGGTIIVLADGRRFKRDYSGDISVKWFAAVGDWNGVSGSDDTNAIQAAINVASITGVIVKCVSGESYRITSGLTINSANTVLDLNGAKLIADFAAGNAVTVGNTAVLDSLGVRNGTIASISLSTALNGVVFKKNVRRNVQYGGLRITGFKGIGLQFEELNWSIQAKDAPIIESCGINLDIHDNGNALEIAGAGLDGATTYNVRLRGTFGITFVGGYNQFAGAAGVLIDNSTIGAIQPANSTSFYGTYFEGNGVSHIIGNNGRGLVVHGCYINAAGMTGVLIDLNNWTGAFIQANNPNNTSGRDFVNADATSSLICVGRQAVSSQSDTLIGGAMNAFVSDDVPVQVSSLPNGSILNLGSRFLLNGTGTGANRSLPYICTTIASGSRAFRRMALEPVKQAAQSGAASYTPNIGNTQCFDLTVPSAGMNIEAPIGAYDDGDEVIFILRQSSTPSAGVTWNAVYKTDISSALLANGYGSVTFRWSAGRGFWIQTGKLEWKA